MIIGIQLHNYQSHALTKMSLAPGVNAIVGPSDGGKSAILRAVSWVATNRPSGEGSRRHGSEGGWGVVVALEDGQHISRSREEPDTGGGNCYAIAPPTGKAQVYEAMGQDVPEGVASVLRLPPLCFQRQMDPPYLLSESAGEFARRLNEVAGLDVLDRAQSNISRAARDEDRRVGDEDAALTQAKAEYTLLEWVPKAAGMLAAVETAAAEVEKRRANWTAAKLSYSAIHAITMQINALPDWKSIGARLAKTDDAAAALVKRRLRANTLRRAKAEWDRLTDELSRAVATEDRQMDEYTRMIPKTCPLCGRTGK